MPFAQLERLDVNVDGATVSLRVGPPGDANVLFLHGIPGSSATWARVVAALPGGVRPIVPDLVGFGASDRSLAIDDLHAEGQARRLLGAVSALGVERAIVVAHDFGGPVALRMLMSDPGFASGLVLAATNAFSDTPVPFPLSMVRTPVCGTVVPRLLFARASLAAMCRLGSKRARVDTRAALGDNGQVAAIRTIFAESLRRLPELYAPIEAALPAIRASTDVVWGERDPFFDVEQGRRLAASIPDCRFRLADGCGHFLPDECPELFAEIIAGRLSRAAPLA